MNYESEAYIGTDGSTKITTTGNEAEIYIDSTTAHQKIDRQSYWGRLKSFLGGVSLGISGINIVAAGFELVQPIVTHQAPNGWSLLQLATAAATSAVASRYLCKDGIRDIDIARSKKNALIVATSLQADLSRIKNQI